MSAYIDLSEWLQNRAECGGIPVSESRTVTLTVNNTLLTICHGNPVTATADKYHPPIGNGKNYLFSLLQDSRSTVWLKLCSGEYKRTTVVTVSRCKFQGHECITILEWPEMLIEPINWAWMFKSKEGPGIDKSLISVFAYHWSMFGKGFSPQGIQPMRGRASLWSPLKGANCTITIENNRKIYVIVVMKCLTWKWNNVFCYEVIPDNKTMAK